MPSIRLVRMYAFRCPMCGKAGTVRLRAVDGDEADELAREEYDLNEWEEPDDEQLGGWYEIPDEVTCRHCKQSLKVKAVV